MNAPQPVTTTTDIRLMNATASLLFGLVLLGALISAAWWFTRLPQFSLKGIQVSGHATHTTPFALRSQVLPRLTGNFFSIRLEEARDVFEQQPWVRQAVVSRVFPNQLAVRLEEHEEVAYWGDDEEGMRLLNRQGEVFDGNPEEVANIELPRLAGPDEQSAAVLLMYRRLGPLFNPLEARITALDLDPRGYWSLSLNNDTVINLGSGNEQELAARIRQFVQTIGAVTARYGRSFADLQYADLRYKTGYALRLKGVGTLESPDGNAGKGQPTKPKT